MHSFQAASDIDWSVLLQRQFTSSPEEWEDQTLYFVMIDRFSDGKEREYRDLDGNLVHDGTSPPYTVQQKNSILESERAATAWRQAGNTFCGGTLAGLYSKLGYLQRLGVTCLWLSPVLKQAPYDPTTYHGYGTQNFLEIEPHFGTKEELKTVVDQAHKLGMYVVLDIIVNHAGNVFTYAVPDRSEIDGPVFNQTGKHPVVGFNDESGKPTLPFGPVNVDEHPNAWPDGAVWPSELQGSDTFSQRGAVEHYEEEQQFLHGDFMKLKDIDLGTVVAGRFQPSNALQALTLVYQYWLAYADLDGFRLDAVKHMEPEAVKYFVHEIQSFTKLIGKKNLYIIGEVAGGRAHAKHVMQVSGLSAVVAVDDIPGSLERMVKGLCNPEEYFSYFDDKTATNESTSLLPSHVVTMYDDHDQIRNGYSKARFAAGDERWTTLSATVLAALVCTVGIPSIYYGSEQAFDGEGGDDNYIRECMFGGPFGPFRSTGYHCFNESSLVYQSISRLLAIRKRSSALRRGSQQLIKTSGDGEHFGIPQMIGNQLQGIIAWLRVTENETLLCALNTDTAREHIVAVELDGELQYHQWQLIFSLHEAEGGAKLGQRLQVPAAGFVIYRLSGRN